MKTLLQAMSAAALVATIAPPLLFMAHRVTLDQVHGVMLAATVVWFVTASLWMKD